MSKLTLATKRTLDVEILKNANGYIYFRTREVAQVLGVKQQFEFNADIKRALGVNAILKGEDTLGFRKEEDTDRTTFVGIMNLFVFLTKGEIHHKMIEGAKDALCDELARLISQTFWKGLKD